MVDLCVVLRCCVCAALHAALHAALRAALRVLRVDACDAMRVVRVLCI